MMLYSSALSKTRQAPRCRAIPQYIQTVLFFGLLYLIPRLEHHAMQYFPPPSRRPYDLISSLPGASPVNTPSSLLGVPVRVDSVSPSFSPFAGVVVAAK